MGFSLWFLHRCLEPLMNFCYTSPKHNYFSAPCSVLFLFGHGLPDLWTLPLLSRKAHSPWICSRLDSKVVTCWDKNTKLGPKSLGETLAVRSLPRKQVPQYKYHFKWREPQAPKEPGNQKTQTTLIPNRSLDACEGLHPNSEGQLRTLFKDTGSTEVGFPPLGRRRDRKRESRERGSYETSWPGLGWRAQKDTLHWG